MRSARLAFQIEMKLLVDTKSQGGNTWAEAFAEAFRDYLKTGEVVTRENLGDPSQVTTLVPWNNLPGGLGEFTKLCLIASPGAGVEHILSDPSLPPEVYVTRVKSPILSTAMTNYCLGAILSYHRQFDRHFANKRACLWDQYAPSERDLYIGIMGLGQLGGHLAKSLAYLGFEVCGLSKSRKKIEGVTSFVTAEMSIFLSTINVLVCMLPATPENEGILCSELFKQLNKPTLLINVSRGHHQVETDIIKALGEGRLTGAFLDVFEREPLPIDHPLWSHPRVFITPHVAAIPQIKAAVAQIAKDHLLVVRGYPPLEVVSRERGY